MFIEQEQEIGLLNKKKENNNYGYSCLFKEDQKKYRRY